MANFNSTLHLQDHSQESEIELLINIFPLLVIELDYYTRNYIITMNQVEKMKYILSWFNIRMNHCWYFNLHKSLGKCIKTYLALGRSGKLKPCL